MSGASTPTRRLELGGRSVDSARPRPEQLHEASQSTPKWTGRLMRGARKMRVVQANASGTSVMSAAKTRFFVQK